MLRILSYHLIKLQCQSLTRTFPFILAIHAVFIGSYPVEAAQTHCRVPDPAGVDPYPYPTGVDPDPAGVDPYPYPNPAGVDTYPYPTGVDPDPAGVDPYPYPA